MLSNISGIQNNVSFGHKIIVDNGASKPNNGTLKISVISDVTGEEIYSYRGEVCPEGFKNNDDYIQGIIRGIQETLANCSDKIKTLTRKDRKLSGIVIYSPGATINNQAPIIPNLKLLGTQTSLTNINYNGILSKLRAFLSKLGIKIRWGCKLMATNDMIGAGAAIAKQLLDNPAFKEGYNALFLMAGGGLGVGEINHMGKNVLVKTSESGHINVFGTNHSLESYGASAKALIRNYAEALGLGQAETEKLIKAGDAKRVLEAASDPAKKDAVKVAVERFIEAISIISANKVTEGVNSVILTGPLTNGIKDFVEREKDLFGGQSFDDLVKAQIHSRLDSMGSGMAKLYNFNLITDISVPNNTVGGALALEGRFIGGETRGNVLSIPMKALSRCRRI